ncbi:hypothetical protein TRM7615_04511 [Falsiruegeria mediterranea M17]|uniref:Uncharacterized protein n=1 Tax=Falsiruegeria mediterranea M17 TaxID=1200281 RepID=A0A2R8CEU2_9RHOB|nr:hypothetical protein TRM7615_04511 [Falsiruegeria mediterranea M17]
MQAPQKNGENLSTGTFMSIVERYTAIEERHPGTGLDALTAAIKQVRLLGVGAIQETDD